MTALGVSSFSGFYDTLICLLPSHRNSCGMIFVTFEGSLNQSMDKVVRRYSSLFELPSHRILLLLLVLCCLGGGSISLLVLFPLFEAVIGGLFFGSAFFIMNLILDYLISNLVLVNDPIYDFRRTSALSVFCLVLWFFFVFLGVIVAALLDTLWWIRLCLLGFSAVLIFRLVVFNSTSSIEYKRLIVASLLQPACCVVSFTVVWSKTGHPITFYLVFFFFISIAMSLLSSFFLINLLNRKGKQTLGIPSLSLFKAFLLNWIVNLNAPFEEFLEKLGNKQDITAHLIKFDNSTTQAFIVIPSVHPGPFKNVGSSLLPSLLKTTLESRLNAVACVPLGLLGHELDLASQMQNQRIINEIINSADLKSSEARATPFVKVTTGLATACCQIFGKFALVLLTLAPETTEDLPQELDRFINREADKRGLNNCAVVNAHNSINGIVDMQDSLNALETAAASCLEQTSSMEILPFEVGAATVIPRELSLEDGMGPGGITVIIIKVDRQKTAYVVIDGNNMVSGLREKILSALKSINIDEGEVLTTDTHSVNAVTLSERGYYPIGEAIPHEKLIRYVEETTLAALSNLKCAKAAARDIMIRDVKVIGEKKLETLCLLTERTLRDVKKNAIPLFVATGSFLTLLLAFV